MERSRILQSIKHILVFGVLVGSTFTPTATLLRADDDTRAEALWQQVINVYESAPSFSCDGHYESGSDAPHSGRHTGTFKILFSRPDLIRVDWSDLGTNGEAVESSIFTQDNTVYFLFGAINRIQMEPNADEALNVASGLSHGVTSLIPSLLRGHPIPLTSFQPVIQDNLNGVTCSVIKASTRFDGTIEFTIDPATHAILRVRHIRSPLSSDQQKNLSNRLAQFAQAHPEMGIPPLQNIGPGVQEIQTDDYEHSDFGHKLGEADFIYPVPPGVTKIEDNTPPSAQWPQLRRIIDEGPSRAP